MRGCGTSIGTARLQRTRAITRNTHPMCSIGRTMITNFHDTFVLRDVTRRKRALFCNAPPTPQFIFLNRNGNPFGLFFPFPSFISSKEMQYPFLILETFLKIAIVSNVLKV